MARIRSIKPDFFTDEKVAALPLSARLTFIGLWTYVDDNGVGVDNERLIVSAIWPLEEDVAGVIGRTRGDLAALAAAGLIDRYSYRAHRLIHIRTFGKHQRVSHPRKSRYPLPGELVTSENNHSGNSPESVPDDIPEKRGSKLRPEQGAGSREQGAGTTTAEAVNSNVEGTAAPPRIADSELKVCPECKAVLDPDGTCFACRIPARTSK